MLEASYIVFRLPPFHANLGKRLVKSPKLYFYDTGIAALLLSIDRPDQLGSHPLRGSLFETWVVGEVVKAHLHRARRPRLFFYRDRNRTEVDLLLERGGGDLAAVEIKAGQTPSGSYFGGLDRLAETLSGRPEGPQLGERIVVYGGDESQERSRGTLLAWRDLASRSWIPPAR